MRILPVLLSLTLATASFGQINIIPKPVSVTQPKVAGKFMITSNTKIVLLGSRLERTAQYLRDYLNTFYGLQLEIRSDDVGQNTIALNFDRMDKGTGAYNMIVNKNGVYIGGDNEAGVFYGVQSLIQLLPMPANTVEGIAIPVSHVNITDYPRFEYRGLMLDAGRHFFSVDYVKKFIDFLALHKMNYFHWHLTDDQGWRVEIKKYPRLTEVGAWRNGTIIGKLPGTGNDKERSGGFYTQEDIKDIVAYASDRFVTIVPEIEMPGHGGAAIAAYPWLSCFPDRTTKSELPNEYPWYGDTTGKQVSQVWGVHKDVFCAGKEETFQFLQDVVDEIIPLFPGRYLHVGGDECPKNHWKECPNCQKRMKDNKLRDEHALQSYFVQRMEKYINSKGKSIIGWDEILEGGLAPKAIVMSWRGEAGGIEAAKQKHQAIMTPTDYVYLDYAQQKNEDSLTIGGFIDLEKVYNYEPYPKAVKPEQTKYILGAQGNLWTEYIATPSKLEYMLFPRATALSEVVWSPKQNKNWKDFQKRLQVQAQRYDLWKMQYCRPCVVATGK